MSRIFIAGHAGMVGSALKRALSKDTSNELILRTRSELDLTDQVAVASFFKAENIDQVYLAAARVGGIHANNTYPANFIYENLMIEANIIHQAFRSGVQKLLFLGSSCIYPKGAPQPMREDALLTGPLEPTNEPYAIAKIAGIKMCESYNRQYGESDGIDYRSIMPTNLYGPGDNYHAKNSHVVPALIRRFCEAKKYEAPSVTIWGTGKPRREFLHVNDMAAASIFVMNMSKLDYEKATQSMQSHINVGYGSDVTIAELAQLIAEAIGYNGELWFDTSKPDGTMRKLMDTEKLQKMGWRPTISLAEGILDAISDFSTSRYRISSETENYV
jgi:GDP-L-fucose synthase